MTEGSIVGMPIRTGRQFIEQLDRMQNVIWIDGQRVDDPISQHPAFAGTIRTKAELYEAQHDPARVEYMTWLSPTTGERAGLSYMPPLTHDDLLKRRRMSREWALLHGGWMGRAPDYTNTALMTFATAAPLFGSHTPAFGERIRQYYEHCRDNDLSLAHTFIRPPVDRNNHDPDDTDDRPSLSVVDKRSDGIVVNGARLMATQGGITDELLVFPTYIPEVFAKQDHPLAFAFGIPSNTPGLSFIGRRNYSMPSGQSPLASRLDEIDMLIRFDHVLVPWERVFAYGDVRLANTLYEESGFYSQAMHQVLTRVIVKTEWFIALMSRMIKMFDLAYGQHIRDSLTRAVITAESLRALQLASEAGAAPNAWGVLTPAPRPLYTALLQFGKAYPRMVADLQRIGGSHLIANATDNDLSSENGEWLRKTLAAPDRVHDGSAKSRLYRLAWDACASSFAARQTIYEQYFFGDPLRLADRLTELDDSKEDARLLERFL